jgi:hypothetical protein
MCFLFVAPPDLLFLSMMGCLTCGTYSAGALGCTWREDWLLVPGENLARLSPYGALQPHDKIRHIQSLELYIRPRRTTVLFIVAAEELGPVIGR